MTIMVRKTVISTCGILKTFQNMNRIQIQVNSDKYSESVLAQLHEGNSVFTRTILVRIVIRCDVVPSPKTQK